MAERVYEAQLKRAFSASRLTVWGLVSDTNRWDRASGLTPGRYSWNEVGGERFGTTVNVAARLQARADGGQLVVTQELAAQPEIRALIAPFSASPFKARLKGIATEPDLLAVHVAPVK